MESRSSINMNLFINTCFKKSIIASMVISLTSPTVYADNIQFIDNNVASGAIDNLPLYYTKFYYNSSAGSSIITNYPGDISISGNKGGETFFLNNSTAGSSTIYNIGPGISSTQSGRTIFFNNASAGNAIIKNISGGSTAFYDESTAADTTISNDETSSLDFTDYSTAGNAAISNFNRTQFSGDSSAGNATITNYASDAGANGNHNKIIDFFDNATASSATINNIGPGSWQGDSVKINFYDNTTAGNAVITSSGGSSISFMENSTAEDAIINNNMSSLTFVGSSTADNAVINNFNSSTYFQLSASAGNAHIKNDKSSLIFENESTAENAIIVNQGDGTIKFTSQSTAGSSKIKNIEGIIGFEGGTADDAEIESHGYLYFTDGGSVGNANITSDYRVQIYSGAKGGNGVISNDKGVVYFSDSNAENITIKNLSGDYYDYSDITFDYNSGAGFAQIANDRLGKVNFFNNSSAENASITNKDLGTTTFTSSSTAENANITNIDNGITAFQGLSGASHAIINNIAGTTYFSDSASAQNASIQVSKGSGWLYFHNSSTAENANINLTEGAAVDFFNNTSAGNSLIINEEGGSRISFNDNSDAGNATIRSNSGWVSFSGHSNPGLARLVINDDAILNLSGTTPNSDNKYTAGSIEGNGTFHLGGAELKTGLNNLSTEVTGTIDGGGWISGSLIKAGSGTLTLSGVGNYGAGTTIEQGAIIAKRTGALGRGTVVNNALLEFTDNASAEATQLLSSNIVNNGSLIFSGNSSTGHTSLTTNGTGITRFLNNSSLNNASLFTQEGGVVDLSATTGVNGDGQLQTGSIAGGGQFYLGSNQLQVGSNNASTEVSGVIADGGDNGGNGASLIKTGSGSLMLTGTNMYSGTTQLQEGTLLVNGSIASSSKLTVMGGTRLEGAGLIGNTVVQAAGILAPGNAIGGLSVVGNLSLASGSLLEYELVAAGISDHINVSGDLDLGGSLNLSGPDEIAGIGYYRLISYGGTLSGAGLSLGTTPASLQDHQFSIDASQLGAVDLRIAEKNNTLLQEWVGGTGTWSNSNWRTEGAVADSTWNGQYAIFKGNSGTVTIDGNQSFKGLQFISDGWQLTSTGAGELQTSDTGSELRVLQGNTAVVNVPITGNGSVEKTQEGTLVLRGQNTYTGGTALTAGVLSVASEENLGATTGALTLDGGVLQVTGNQFNTTRRTIIWGSKGAGFDIVDAGNQFTLSQNIIGQGELLKRGEGILVLDGNNQYGNTQVETGTLRGNSFSISGDLVNNGTVLFQQDINGNFAGNISGAGQMVKTGNAALMLTGYSTSDWHIQSGALISSPGQFGGNVDLDNAGTLVFTQPFNAEYSGIVSGTGSLVKQGEGLLRLTGDSSAFAGQTQVMAGTLSVGYASRGNLGGTITVLEGGTLAGTGTVGTTLVDMGGILAPGNSIGTLTVEGDLTLAQGSHYQLEASSESSSSDMVHVTGVAQLGGSVVHVGPESNFTTATRYRILEADGGVQGKFESVSSNYAFLDAKLGYAPQTVTLELERKIINPEQPEERAIDFADVAKTRNQQAVAVGLESLPSNSTLYQRILLLQENEPTTAFESLSGEIYASNRVALLDDARFLGQGIEHHLNGNTAAAVLPENNDVTLWIDGTGRYARHDGNNEVADARQRSHGVILGMDTAVGQNWRLGIAGGASKLDQQIDQRASNSDADATHYGAYALANFGVWGIRSAVTNTDYRIDSKRQLSFGGSNQTLTASYNASAMVLQTEVSYRSDWVQPYLGVTHTRLSTDAVREQGGDAALSVNPSNDNQTTNTIGLRKQWDIDKKEIGSIKLTSGVAWQHTWGNDSVSNRQQFIGGGDSFTVYGLPLATDQAVVDLGGSLSLTKSSYLSLGYQGRVSSKLSDQSLKMDWRLNF